MIRDHETFQTFFPLTQNQSEGPYGLTGSHTDQVREMCIMTKWATVKVQIQKVDNFDIQLSFHSENLYVFMFCYSNMGYN